MDDDGRGLRRLERRNSAGSQWRARSLRTVRPCVWTADALGHTTVSISDPGGRFSKTIFADGSFAQNVNGVNGEPVTTDAGGNSLPSGIIPSDLTIPAGGREEVKIEQRKPSDTGNPIATFDIYDATGRLTDVYLPAVPDPSNNNDPVAPHWVYTYDPAGNQLTQADPNGHTTSFAYDDQDRRIGRTLPDGESESWTYDDFGRTATHTDFDHQTTKETYYDTGVHAGQLDTEYRYAANVDPATGQASEKTVYGYDDLGRQSSVDEYTWDTGTSTWDTVRTESTDYDPISGGITESDAPEGNVYHAYDPATGRLSRTRTAHNDTSYEYDSLGRLWHVVQTKLNGQTVSLTTTYEYDAAGNLDTVTLPNGIVTDYDYDVLNRLTHKIVMNDTGSTPIPVFEQTFTLLSDGQRDHVIENRWDGSGNLFSTTKIAWTYDNENRLLTETRDEGNDGIQNDGDYTAAYTLDLAGNRLAATTDRVGTANDEVITDSYTNPSNGKSGDDRLYTQTRTVGGVGGTTTVTNYAYDANGSTTSVTQGSNVTSYTWDLRGRMASATVNGTTTLYGYGSDGIRVSETTGTAAIHYVNDKANPTGYSQILEEKASPAADPSLSYIIGNDVIAQAGPGSDASTKGYYIYDGHGSVRGLANGGGTFVSGSGYEYDGFGVGLNFTIATAASHLLYTGEAADAVTGMYYLRARFYNPSIDRFNSFDPAENDTASPQSLHKYLYAGANPIMYGDPSGHDWSLCGITVNMATIVRVGLGIGFGVTGAWNLAMAAIHLQRAYAASTSGSTNVTIIGWMALSILEAWTGKANIDVANALLFGVATPTIPSSGLGVLWAAFATAGNNGLLMGEAVCALSPALAGTIANAAGAFLAASTLFSTSFGSGGSLEDTLRARVAKAVQENLTAKGDLYADATSLKKLSGPTEMSSNKDPTLGPNQVRYYATMENEVTGEVTNYSVNYDPDTGQFGIIKKSSIQP